jgi:hypothetical protein
VGFLALAPWPSGPPYPALTRAAVEDEQWGWGVLLVGTLLLFAAAAMRWAESREDQSW